MIDPLVSVLTVSNRPKFYEWCAWNVGRQSYTNIEWIFMPSWSKTSVAALRNRAVAAAHGEYIVWQDDDDWMHPDKVGSLVSMIEHELMGAAKPAVYAGWDHGHFFDLQTRKATLFRGAHPLFCAAIYRRDAVELIRFTDSLTEDTDWLHLMETRFGPAAVPLSRLDWVHSLWLQHGYNINTRPTTGYDMFVDDLGLSKAEWGTTTEQLRRLEQRLEEA